MSETLNFPTRRWRNAWNRTRTLQRSGWGGVAGGARGAETAVAVQFAGRPGVCEPGREADQRQQRGQADYLRGGDCMSWCSFCKRLEGETHTDECVQHGGHVCLVAGDCRERPGRICRHSRLDEDGICRACGQDCRGISLKTPLDEMDTECLSCDGRSTKRGRR